MRSSDYLSPGCLPAFICSWSSNLKLYSIHGALKLIISEIAECVVLIWLTNWMLQHVDKVRNLLHSIRRVFNYTSGFLIALQSRVPSSYQLDLRIFGR
jgi:hypothetical protein